MHETMKQRMLLPHRIEHHAEHAQEVGSHTELSEMIRDQLLAAARLLGEANIQLSSALDALGGPLALHRA